MACRSSARDRLLATVAALAAMCTVPMASHQAATRTVRSVPLFVSQANRPPLQIAASPGTTRLRASAAADRLPTSKEPIRTFAAGEVAAAPMLLAEAQGRVVGYSPITGELVSYEVANERSSVLLPPGQLPPGLNDLEFSSRGVAVLAEFAESTTLFVVTISPATEQRPTWSKVTIPIRASDTALSLRGLLVLSDQQHALFEIPLGDLPQPNRPPVTPRIAPVLKDLPSPAVAVAEWRDVYYVALGQNLLVVPREMPARGNVTSIPASLESIDAIRVSENHLIAVDTERGRVAVSYRPVPATIRFHGDARDTTGRLLHVFDVLARYRLLPTRAITIDRDNSLELLMEHGVLPRIPADSVSDDLRTRVESLLCALNPSVCSPLRLTRGSPLRVPNVPLNEQPVTTRESFRGRTLDDVLRERLLPQHRPADHQLLLDLLNANRTLDQTLDAKLFRLAFIPWQLAAVTELQPGSLLTLNDGVFARVAQPSGCNVATKTTPVPKDATGFDAILATHRAEQVRTLIGVPGEVDVGFGDVEVVSAPLDAMNGCAEKTAGATHQVTDIIRASPVFLRVRGANAAVQYPEDDRLSAAASYPVKIVPTKRPEWSAVIDDAVVFGFRAQPLAAATIGSNASIASVPLHDLLRRRFETLTVPVTGWEPLVFVPSAELAAGTNLRTIQSRGDPLVTISPHQRSLTQTTAASLERALEQPRILTDAQRRDEGERLRRIISYPANPPDTSGLVIAVAEQSGSVDRAHPDFRRQDGFNVWSKESEDGNGVALEEFPAPATADPREERDFVMRSDHGTHVAGLLAGVGLPVGLAPQAYLFLVPIEQQAHDIKRTLEFVARIPVSVANFSQTIAADDSTKEEIGGALDQLADSLLVVAATGNQGTELTRTSAPLPIGWSDGPNVIGVAAADDRRQLTDESDRGKQFVQLLAVGKNVLSLANKGGYARTSGASQAAPQVAGAAALLVAAGEKTPSQIKARLIATADWHQSYEDKVWGGFLNVDRAVSHLISNVLTRPDATGNTVRLSVNFRPSAKLQLKKSIEYPPNEITSSLTISDGEIEWARVLRIVRQTWLPASHRDRDLYRVVYLEPEKDPRSGSQLRIKKNVEFKPNQSFPFVRCAPLNPTALPLAPPTDAAAGAAQCVDPLRPEQIEDYVAMFPGQNIRFTRTPQR